MKFSEYLLDRDEDMAFYLLEQSLRNEGLLRGLKGIWNIARGGKYNKDDAQSAMQTSNLIANVPDVIGAGKGIYHTLRNLGLGTGIAMGGGDANYQPPEPVPIVKAHVPSQHMIKSDDDDPISIDVYRSAKGSRKAVSDAEEEAMKFGKMSAFSSVGRKKRNKLSFIDQTPSA